MRFVLILATLLTFATICQPAEAGPLCAGIHKVGHGIGRVLGVERRQARRAALAAK